MIYEFRAWDEENKIIIYKDSNLSKDSIGYSEYYSNNPVNMLMNIFSDYSELVWELWTGRFDDEGNRIWQGDIIEIKCIADNTEVLEHLITEVVFDDDCGSFGFQTDKDGEMYYMDSLPRKDKVNYWSHYDTCKVVGNIHEGVKNEKIS